MDKNKDISIQSLIFDYYKNYYKTQLGLPDWEVRARSRVNEENVYCSKFIDWIEEWIDYNFSGKKVLVVGCGTGGELVNLNSRAAKVYGVEPNTDALEICHIKCKDNNIPVSNVVKAYSESLPFDDNTFDFVYCFTVLEHVGDVDVSIQEMVRCVKKGGKVFIETPDYRQLYEGHYKLPLPMFLPIWLNKIILTFAGRPTEFLGTINKVNGRMLLDKFSSLSVTAIRIYKDGKKTLPKFSFKFSYVAQVIQFLIYAFFKVEVNQVWILHKNK